MGLFAKIKESIEEKQKQRAEEERLAREKAEEERKQKKENRKKEIIEKLEVACTYKYITLEERLREKLEDSEYKESGFDFYLTYVAHVSPDLMPGLLLEELIGMFEAKGDALEYVGPTKSLVMTLKFLLRDYVTDDNEEVRQCARIVSPKDLLPIENNPVLYFAFNFEGFELGDESSGSFKDKFHLYNLALQFISHCLILKKTDIIEKNKWLFDEKTYLNDFDMIRKDASFFQKIRESIDDDFVEVLDYLENK